MYGGSFNDDEKKYKYKFFKAVSDKKYKKLDAYVLKYADHTKDIDVKNMFGGLIDATKLEEYKKIVDGTNIDDYMNVIKNYEEKLKPFVRAYKYFKDVLYKKAKLLDLETDKFMLEIIKFGILHKRLKHVYTLLEENFNLGLSADTTVDRILTDEFNVIKKDFETCKSLIEKEKTKISSLIAAVKTVINAENQIETLEKKIETLEKEISNKKILGSATDLYENDLKNVKNDLDNAKITLKDANTKLVQEFNKVTSSTPSATKLPMNYALLDSQYYNNPNFFYNKSDGPEKDNFNIKIYKE